MDYITDEQIIKHTELGQRHVRQLNKTTYAPLNIVAHPSMESRKLSDVIADDCYSAFRGGFLGRRHFPKITLCIGPEGGWTDGELETTMAGFEKVSMGPRVYKTYDAPVAMLSLLYE